MIGLVRALLVTMTDPRWRDDLDDVDIDPDEALTVRTTIAGRTNAARRRAARGTLSYSALQQGTARLLAAATGLRARRAVAMVG